MKVSNTKKIQRSQLEVSKILPFHKFQKTCKTSLYGAQNLENLFTELYGKGVPGGIYQKIFPTFFEQL